MDLSVSELPSNFSKVESFARSDQIVFAQAGIPAALIMEGVTYDHLDKLQGIKKQVSWMQNVYHTPFDDIEQPISWNAVEQHCQLLTVFTWNLANSKDEPHWRPGTPYLTARLQSIAEKK